MPAIIKPATSTSYVAEACFRMMVESGLLPDGAVQLIVGSTGDLLDQLGSQDVVSFTGSADTALMLRSNPKLMQNATRSTVALAATNSCLLGASHSLTTCSTSANSISNTRA